MLISLTERAKIAKSSHDKPTTHIARASALAATCGAVE